MDKNESDYCYRMAACLGWIRVILQAWEDTGNGKRAMEEVRDAISAMDHPSGGST